MEKEAGWENVETFHPPFPTEAYWQEEMTNAFITLDHSLGVKPTKDFILKAIQQSLDFPPYVQLLGRLKLIK